jgi:glycine oxidase
VHHPILIVGSGVIGCAIARELALRGVDVTVLDPRPVAAGATQASAGMLAPYVEAHDRGAMLDLCVRSLEMYHSAWVSSLWNEGLAVEYQRIGTLEIALTPERTSILRQGVILRQGMPGRWLEPLDVARAYPQLCPTFGAFMCEAHGYVDATQLATALARSAERHGARFRRVRVDSIERTAGGIHLRVGGDRLVAHTVVLAAGAWTNQIDGVRRPPLRPVRGQLLEMRWESRPLPTIMWGPDCYIVPRTERGAILVGATVEEAGFDERTTDEGVRGLLWAARQLIPLLRDDDLIEARVGLRPATPDELPVLGRDPDIPGLVHASGHYRNGVLLAPVTGKLIADLVADDVSDPALEAFSAVRFSDH